MEKMFLTEVGDDSRISVFVDKLTTSPYQYDIKKRLYVYTKALMADEICQLENLRIPAIETILLNPTETDSIITEVESYCNKAMANVKRERRYWQELYIKTQNSNKGALNSSRLSMSLDDEFLPPEEDMMYFEGETPDSSDSSDPVSNNFHSNRHI